MTTTKKHIIHQLKDNLEQEGYFWRLARTETFIDLLKIQAGKSSTVGISEQLVIDVILTTIKALINKNLGVQEFYSDYKKLNKELFQQQDTITKQADQILTNNLLKSINRQKSHPLPESDQLHYFQALNKIEEADITPVLFEEVLITFLGYFNPKGV